MSGILNETRKLCKKSTNCYLYKWGEGGTPVILKKKKEKKNTIAAAEKFLKGKCWIKEAAAGKKGGKEGKHNKKMKYQEKL